MQQDNIKIRWGIIGCGDVTEVKSGPAYQLVEGFELTAVMRRDLEKARDYARRHGVPKVHETAEALIKDPEIDAIYIATPPDSHHAYALQVAAAGKPCCVEKPMAPTHAQCLEMVDAFEQKSLPLFVAYYRRSLPRFTQIKQWLDEGRIGKVRHVEWQLCKPPSTEDLSGRYKWRTDATIAAGGYFDDLASHGLDLIAHYLGNFQNVSGHATNQQGLYTAYDSLAASWIHKNGITGTGSWNFGSAKSEDHVEILGSEGTIEFSVFKDAPIRLKTQTGVNELMIEHPTHVQQPHVERMRDTLLGNRPHVSTGETGAHSTWAMDQILSV